MKTKVKKGEIIARGNSNDIVVMKWQDTREVHLLTTKLGLDIVDVQKKTCQLMATTSSSGDQSVKAKKTCCCC